MHAFRRGLTALFHSLRSIAHLVQHPRREVPGSSKTTRSSPSDPRSDFASTGTRFSASTQGGGDALTFAFHWKAILSGGAAWAPFAQKRLPLEGKSAQEALQAEPRNPRADSASTGRPICAGRHREADTLRFCFHWNAFLGEKRACSNSPSSGTQIRAKRPSHRAPSPPAGVDSNRVAPRVSRRRLPQPRTLL